MIDTLTSVHVIISLIGIFAGFIVVGAMISGGRLDAWHFIFLAATVLTNVTAFMFPFSRLLPSHVVGIVSLLILPVAIYALYVGKLQGNWRWIYVTTATAALYLNFFVLVAQTFNKVPSLSALAPTQSEPPFAIAQATALLIFLVLGYLSVKGFKAAA